MAVSCFTRTIQRETYVVDFSWKTFDAGLCLLQAKRTSSYSIFAAFFSSNLTSLLATLFIVLFIFANLLWLAERRDNPDFKGDGTYSDGIWHALWFITVTFTTIGYGDKTPITNVGKTSALTWMFVALGFHSVITGTMTAYLTISSKRSNLYGWRDLSNDNQLLVAAVRGSATLTQLSASGIVITHPDFVDEQAMYGPLMRGEVDVVIADGPVVYGDMRRGLIPNTEYVCHDQLNDETYGLAFPNNANLHLNLSTVLTKVNAGMMKWDKSAAKDEAFDKYFIRDVPVEDDGVLKVSPPSWTTTNTLAVTLFVALVGEVCC